MGHVEVMVILLNVQTIISDYEKYLNEDKGLKSTDKYVVVINSYLTTYLGHELSLGQYEGVFSIEKVLSFSKNNPRGEFRASLVNLLELFRKQEVLEHLKYLEIKDALETAFSHKEHNETRQRKNNDFLTLRDIKFIFSGSVKFLTEDEEKTAPLVFALTFLYGMEQRYVCNLQLKDFNLKENLIRNVFHDEDDNLVEWLDLDVVTKEYLITYLSYREKLNIPDDKLFNTDGLRDHEFINPKFYVFMRNENRFKLDTAEINSRLLIRSMMFYALVSSDGLCMRDFLMRFKRDNRQFISALNEYLTQYKGGVIGKALKLEDIIAVDDRPHSVLPDRGATNEKNLQQNIETDFLNKFELYSEEKDLNMDDFLDYLESKQNLESNKITIQRMVRDSNIAKWLKEKYGHRCQLCSYRLRNSNDGYYSEAHHIRPYNKIHRGDDSVRNLIILCPNCHAQFDDLYFAINPDDMLVHCAFEDEDYHMESLYFIEGHTLGREYLEYTWSLFLEKNKDKNKQTSV